MKRKYIKQIFSILIVILLAMSLSSCWLIPGMMGSMMDGYGEDYVENYGSMEYIERPGNWQKHVQNGEFKFGAKKPIEYEVSYGSYPCIDGSTVAIPMAMEFARQHLGLSDNEIGELIDFSTTHEAYTNLIDKESVINEYETVSGEYIYLEDRPVDIFIGTEPSDAELNYAKQRNVELIKKPVCWDAFVFITHKDNPVDSLTLDQVRKIYSGEIKNWKDVGGEDLAIDPYQREPNSGSQTAMEKLVMKGAKMISPKREQYYESMGGLVDAVMDYRNGKASIGYTYKYYVDVLYKQDNIKILKIDGITPDAETIRSGSYPFTTNYYGVIRSTDQNKVGGKFLDWMVSYEGQKCIAQAGYIPMK